MKVILTTNIKKLGRVGDQIIVKSGFARNFLLPKNMVLRNTQENLKYFEKIKDEINIKENDKKEKATNLIEKIKKLKIEFKKESDDKEQLYGSISKKEIINFLNNNEIKIMSDDIKISEPIRTLGQHTIEINPYEEISAQIVILVKKT
jgi:large subunit ribosomal protein L9